MKGSLYGANAKLSRAKAQAENLKMSIEALYPRNRRWPVTTVVAKGGLEYRFSVDVSSLPPVDPNWTLAVGEIMFNLRSALDHLQYQLWFHHYRGHVPPQIEFFSMFPILTNPKKFKDRQRQITKECNKLKKTTLSQRDWTALEFLQPYVTRKDELRWDRYWLERLNTLHNFDKHRRLHVVSAAQNAAAVPDGLDVYGLETFPSWGSLDSSGLVEVWRFNTLPPKVPPHSGALLHVTLDHQPAWAEINIFLPALIKTVETVLTRFANRFT